MNTPPNISVYSNVPLDLVLIDKRNRHKGISFGKVRDICAQYGIEYEEGPYSTRFYAPKTRLQMFVDKLHFSRSDYTEEPF